MTRRPTLSSRIAEEGPAGLIRRQVSAPTAEPSNQEGEGKREDDLVAPAAGEKFP